jgi:hypothetical protein
LLLSQSASGQTSLDDIIETARRASVLSPPMAMMIGAHQAGIRTNGRAATLEEAKEQFETNYRRWLVWAKLEAES